MFNLLCSFIFLISVNAQDVSRESLKEVQHTGKIFSLELVPQGKKTFVNVKLVGENKMKLSLKDFKVSATATSFGKKEVLPIYKDVEKQLYYFQKEKPPENINFLIIHGSDTEKVKITFP